MIRMFMCSLRFSLLLALSIIGLTPAFAEPHFSMQSSRQLDQQTERLLHLLQTGDINTAEQVAANLAQRFPTFALGQLLHAELQATAGQMQLKIDDSQAFSPTLISLLLEAKTRLDQSLAVASSPYTIPQALVHSGPQIDHIIMADLALSRLYVFNTQGEYPRLIREHYTSSGSAGFSKRVEGDRKTPLGIYRIRGYRSDASLPDLYGSGALMLNYPNALDRYLGHTGSGIWLHGVPHKQMSRAPRSSEGCVTMANDYLTSLHSLISLPRTRVILSHNLHWVDRTRIDIESERLQELFEQYREAWVQQSLGDLYVLYESDALPPGLAHREIRAQARRVVSASSSELPGQFNKEHLQNLATLNSDDIAIFHYPTLHKSAAYTIMEFSLDKSNSNHVTLYWRKNDIGQWHIVQELFSDAAGV